MTGATTWTVWVGGIPDDYAELWQAFAAIDYWRGQGYDDVQLERVER